MKRKTILFTAIHVFMVVLLTAMTIYCTKLQDNMVLSFYLGESHAGQTNIAQLFYMDDENDFKKNSALTITFEDNVFSFEVGGIDFSKNILRIDPFNMKEDFSIQQVTLSYGEKNVLSISGKEFSSYVAKGKGLSKKVQGDNLQCTAKNKNPRLITNRAFSKRINRYYIWINQMPYVIFFVLYVILGILEIRLLVVEKKSIYKWHIIGVILATVMMGLGVVIVYALSYFEEHFGQVPFGQLLYHLHTPLDGTDISSYQNVILLGVVLTVLVVVLCIFLRWLLTKKNASRGFTLWYGFLGLLLIAYGGVKACLHFDIVEYYQYTHSSTQLYEENYVDGRSVQLDFPEKKRNLIYIFLESMEITYSDTVSGGALTTSYIPELSKLALEHNCFSGGNLLNGAYQVSGATYTMGALAAQTCGVPINENMVSNDTLNGTWESESNCLPGVWSIGDILHEQGYHQEFLIGSNGKFAGRESYFHGHGEYDVEDYNAAIDKERIPSDYKVWWGYEDKKLFDFAKEDAMRLADSEEPFNLTLLTVDTHFTDGYVCDLCGDTYESQYSNVISCSDHQVAEFVQWVQKQSFYEDTTIVIAGDHLTPDSYYIANEGASGFDRRTFFTIINPATGKNTDRVQRTYTTLDLYPTTLSAMGVTIDGDRLGLGVDLYSGKPTLAEQMGLENLNTELLKNSEYYTKELLYEH